jgi:hypothetical protein
MEVSPEVLQAMMEEISVSYLFDLASGPTPTPVPSENNVAAPISAFIADFTNGRFDLMVNKVWVNTMFKQNPEKDELLQLSLPNVDGPIDLDGGVSLQQDFMQKIKVAK